jgi:glutathione synthase/RimK-type ligase-like ATP-grasp enzyme
MAKKPLNLLCLPSFENIEQMLVKFPFPIKLTEGNFYNLEFIFQGSVVKVLHNGVDLNSFDFVWLSSFWDSRDLSYAISLYLEKTKTFSTYVEKSTSKITDQMICALGGIQTPHTLFLGKKNIEKNLKQIKEICGYPLIIKDVKGALGNDSKYIATENDLLENLDKLPKHKRYLFQQYIPNQYDWGILVANGAVVSGEQSYPQNGEFRNNACNGGREVFAEVAKIPAHIKEMAIKASKLLGLSWSRSDIVVDKDTNNAYLMEVNRSPRITPKTSEVEGAYKFLSSQIKNLPKDLK